MDRYSCKQQAPSRDHLRSKVTGILHHLPRHVGVGAQGAAITQAFVLEHVVGDGL